MLDVPDNGTTNDEEVWAFDVLEIPEEPTNAEQPTVAELPPATDESAGAELIPAQVEPDPRRTDLGIKTQRGTDIYETDALPAPKANLDGGCTQGSTPLSPPFAVSLLLSILMYALRERQIDARD
jgi:hypothetical protein